MEDDYGVRVEEDGTIIITAPSPRGSVIGNVDPEFQLDTEDIRALGASDIGELIEALTPQIGVPPGESPVVLVNGRRISGPAEIERYPREALERVDILPPQVAGAYGYPVANRVINFVLRESFVGGSAQISQGFATAGGRGSQEAKLSLLHVAGETRSSFSLDYRHDSALFESERGIIQAAPALPFDLDGNVAATIFGEEIDPELSALAGRTLTVAGVPGSAFADRPSLADFAAGGGAINHTDVGRFRTLLPEIHRLTFNASLRRTVFGDVAASVTARAVASDSLSRLGLPTARLLLQSTNPFSPFDGDVFLYRYFDTGRPLSREAATRSAQLAVSLSGSLSGWRWSYSGSLDHSRSTTLTDAGADTGLLQGMLADGNPSLNPFAPFDPATISSIARVRSRSVATSVTSRLLAGGSLFSLPAGEAHANLTAHYRMQKVRSETVSDAIEQFRNRTRHRGGGVGILRLPIASRSSEVLAPVGDLTASLRAGVDLQTRSDALLTLGYDVRWTPHRILTLSASMTESEQALSDDQVSGPVVETPNVPVFDFRTGETVDIVRIEGGNPALLSPSRRELRLAALLSLSRQPALILFAGYDSSRISDPVRSLPNPSPEVEAAFPDRYLRNAEGRLLRIDSRPVNFLRSDSAQLSWGFRLMMALGAASSRAAPPPRSPAPVPERNAQARPPGRLLGPPGSAAAGRLIVTFRHEYQLRNEVLIREGLSRLDLLAGSSAGGTGEPRHAVTFTTAISGKAWNVSLNGNWRSSTSVGSGATELTFSDLATINVEASVEIGEQPGAMDRFGWLRGTSLGIDITNLFNSRQDVRDARGETPLNYQPAYRDPLGQSFQVWLRKAF